MPDQDDTISKLLRLKRYEQPPEGYFDDFLVAFRERQRAELLRQPFWRLAMERIGSYFHDLTARQLSYATASAAVLLVATVFTAQTVMAPMDQSMGIASAEARPSVKAPSVIVDRSPVLAASAEATATVSTRPFSMQEDRWLPEAEAFSPARPTAGSTSSTPQPRYILDSRPTSYDAPLDF